MTKDFVPAAIQRARALEIEERLAQDMERFLGRHDPELRGVIHSAPIDTSPWERRPLRKEARA